MLRRCLRQGRTFLKSILKMLRAVVSEVRGQYDVALLAQFDLFSIKAFAVLIDKNLKPDALDRLSGLSIVGYYSFDLDLIGNTFNGHSIQAIPRHRAPVETQGWLVCTSNPFDYFSLSQVLLESGQENQMIFLRRLGDRGTRCYSYVDFFSGSVSTTVHITHYLSRLYGIPYPLPLRYTLRDCQGKPLTTGQVILPENGFRVLSGAELIDGTDIGTHDFQGYLEIEFEIPSKVQPFLHYMVDYESADFLASNHQSGLGVHQAHSHFTRGYVPIPEDETLSVCLFQNTEDQPIPVMATLRWFEEGIERNAEAAFPPLHRREMAFYDVKELFAGIVDLKAMESPIVIVHSAHPLHRPNYYYFKRGHAGFYDTSHAGPDVAILVRDIMGNVPALTKQERLKIKDMNCDGMDLTQFIFPPEYEMDSFLLLGDEMTVEISTYNLKFYDLNGDLIASFVEKIDQKHLREFDLTMYLSNKGLSSFTGTLSLRPIPAAIDIPIISNGISGFRHRCHPYLSTTAGSCGVMDNVPFYFRGGPYNQFEGKSAVSFTDLFARCVSNDEFDTWFAISFRSADQEMNVSIAYEIELINSVGERRLLRQTLRTRGSAYLRLSELIAQTQLSSHGGRYTIWVHCGGYHLNAIHVLYRRADHAIAVEHFYVGRHTTNL